LANGGRNISRSLKRLGQITFIAPATLLSGFATPIENMPESLQPLTLLDPLRYFLVITRGVS
jgi:ABC-2 type transport system permease protein